MRSRPPFRADHVGSLLRPKPLTEARHKFAAGTISAEDLRAEEDNAVTAIVRMQEEVGLHGATDGELRRNSWHMDFIYQLAGVSRAQDSGQSYAFRTDSGETVISAQGAIRVDGPISLKQTIFGDAFTYLRDAVTTAVPKLTIPSPGVVFARTGRALIDKKPYPDLDAFWDDLSKAYIEETKHLYELGCRYLQFDDTSFAELCDNHERERVRGRGDDPDAALEQYVTQLNRVLRSRPAEMAATVHTCRGNFRSAWGAEGGYDAVAERLFSELDVDGFFLEYDDERSGGFEPLRFLRPGAMVVLGLVTTKRGKLESKDDLKRRIDQAAKYVPLEQLCLSPQCGFASVDVGNNLTEDEQRAKLELIVETAEEVWS
jgi:5-methyltetrahydropteroyltriglutamate--homocysteine methyltransferase